MAERSRRTATGASASRRPVPAGGTARRPCRASAARTGPVPAGPSVRRPVPAPQEKFTSLQM
ncbi:hypothetical protein CUT44_17780 [Streptomyces carminius]|uniref:Uncharacterized protein n=1 Tax=Streptomyces carminius TaxID=2665496 RepID=A0A2M8LWN9_9ACTN|nr:hypothetical protein CUT44_17780 [Streptomyces carminius]